MAHVSVSHVAFGILWLALVAKGAILDVREFGEALDKLANEGLGVEEMQEHYDALTTRIKLLDGDQIMSKLKKDLTAKFGSRLTALQNLQASVQLSYEQEEQTAFAECCSLQGLEYDSRFGTEIDADAACQRVSPQATAKHPHNLTEDVLNTMKTNLQNNPSLKWQYFGSEEGVFTIYPAHFMESCITYDNRFRPWYVETATPDPKNVVIVIDKSGSMGDMYEGRTLMRIAKDAANSVLGTMNPSDKVGVVMFSDTVEVPPGTSATSYCYGKELAAANSFNVNYLKSFIDKTVEFGGTHYDKAFNAAFDLLEASRPLTGDPDRDQVILFLTDGEPTDSAVTDYERKNQIMTTIQDRNRVMSNEVIIMTYGLGDDVGLDFLQDIANQNGTKYGVPPDESVGEIKPGRYVHVSDPNNLRTVMASYYDYFSDDVHSDQYIFSVPYQAASGIGLVTTVALPVRHNDELKGVVGVDLALADLTAELTFFRGGQLSYPFVFDGETKAVGRTLVHPQLPVPTRVSDTNNIFIHITTLEREQAFKEHVFDRATGSTAEEGEVTYVSNRYLPRGDSEQEGVQVIAVKTTVYWTKITDSPFVVGLAIADEDIHVELDSQVPSGKDFLYHRIDLVPPGSLCTHFGVEATKEQSAVKFAPEAFKDPIKYLEMEEHEFLVHSYSNYMNDRSGFIPNPGFKDEIRDSVQATAKVNDMWEGDESGVEDFTVVRYIGTEDGVFRQYPGRKMHKYYDPTVRPWYLRAKNNKGKITLSPPYPLRTNYLVTLSHTLISGNQSELASSDEVISVMGLDFTLTYFYRLLVAAYQKCRDDKYSCFVMDESGYFVVHRDFFKDGGQPRVYDEHITQHESHIAQDLINKRVLVKKVCIDMQDIRMQYYYEVAINNSNGEIDNMASGDPCTKYQLTAIPNSNAFLGIIDRSENCKSDSTCPCQEVCVSDSSLDCECPCVTSRNLKYDFCEGEFTLTSGDPPPCPPPVQEPRKELFPNRVKSQDQLPQCFDPRCQDRESYSACFGVLSCAWCNTDKDGELDEPYCTSINDVFQDICTFTPEDTTTIELPVKTEASPDEASSSSSLSSGAVIGIVFGVIIAVVILGILARKGVKVIKVKREERKNQARSVSVDMEYMAVPSAPPPPSAPLQTDPEYMNMAAQPVGIIFGNNGSQVVYRPGFSGSTEVVDQAPTASADSDVDSDLEEVPVRPDAGGGDGDDELPGRESGDEASGSTGTEDGDDGNDATGAGVGHGDNERTDSEDSHGANEGSDAGAQEPPEVNDTGDLSQTGSGTGQATHDHSGSEDERRRSSQTSSSRDSSEGGDSSSEAEETSPLA